MNSKFKSLLISYAFAFVSFTTGYFLTRSTQHYFGNHLSKQEWGLTQIVRSSKEAQKQRLENVINQSYILEETARAIKRDNELYSLEKFNHLFTLDDLPDPSPREVTVQLVGLPLLADSNHSRIAQKLKQNHAQYQINLKIKFQEKLNPSQLKTTKNIGVVCTNKQEYATKMPWNKNHQPIALTSQSTAYLLAANFNKLLEQIKLVNVQYYHQKFPSLDMDSIRKVVDSHVSEDYDVTIATVMAHEIGHICGLYHSEEFHDDNIPNYLDSAKSIPNCMNRSLHVLHFTPTPQNPLGCGFNSRQTKIMSSFLNKGRVYQAMKLVDLNLIRYIEMVGKVNKYHLSLKKPTPD